MENSMKVTFAPPSYHTPDPTAVKAAIEKRLVEAKHIEIHQIQKLHYLAQIRDSYTYNRMGKGNPPVHREGQVVDISI